MPNFATPSRKFEVAARVAACLLVVIVIGGFWTLSFLEERQVKRVVRDVENLGKKATLANFLTHFEGNIHVWSAELKEYQIMAGFAQYIIVQFAEDGSLRSWRMVST